jgi:3-isopropylmalate/(R)-2-methylmalate dehydratase small subunit
MPGKAWKFGDNISTDLIAPGRLFHLRSNLPELAKHVLEDARPDFASLISPGDFVVAGHNFGQGSSREHAPTIIKLVGINAVLAKGFARIFFRNSINIGLPAIICDTDQIEEGNELELILDKGIIKNLTQDTILTFSPLPLVMQRILADGGLVPFIQKHGDLPID